MPETEMLRRSPTIAIPLLIVSIALSGCGSGPLWEQISDGYVNLQLQSCSGDEGLREAEPHRQCILRNFNILTYDKPYLEKLGFRCGFTEQYCLLHHTERQHRMTLLGRQDDHFIEYRTDIYLKYVDRKLSIFKMRYQSVDAQGNIRFRYETPDTLP
jgi:hypothetical protein